MRTLREMDIHVVLIINRIVAFLVTVIKITICCKYSNICSIKYFTIEIFHSVIKDANLLDIDS